MAPRLIKPSIQYKKSFIQAVEEFQKEGLSKNYDIKDLQKNFSDFVKKFKDQENGKSLPKGYVPCTAYWLVNGNDYLGTVWIRHELNKKLSRVGGHIGYEIRPSQRKKRYGTLILKLALPKAKALCIKNALVTCDDANIASWKIIESNGGILRDKITEKGICRRRYWIALSRYDTMDYHSVENTMNKKYTTVFLIRHGGLNNPKKVFYDRELDLRLTQGGRDHIKKLGRKFIKQGIIPDVIYASPLLRTFETAKILKDFFPDTRIVEDRRFLERDSKGIAGKPLGLQKKIGDMYRIKNKNYYLESPQRQAKRMIAGIYHVLQKYSAKTIFIVSHGDPLAFAMYKILHPAQKIPSILYLRHHGYLEMGEAMRLVFDTRRKTIEHTMLF